MAYSKTIDERYYGSFLQYDAGALDAPAILNEVAVLADGSTGYGFLTDTHTLRDIDIYSYLKDRPIAMSSPLWRDISLLLLPVNAVGGTPTTRTDAMSPATYILCNRSL